MIAGFTLKEDSYELREGCDDIGVPFILADVRKIRDKRFELALLSVYNQSEEHREGGSTFANAIYWVSFEIAGKYIFCINLLSFIFQILIKLFILVIIMQLVILEFVTFSSARDEIIIFSAKEPQIVFDSNNEIKPKGDNNQDKPAPIYTWTQSHDEIQCFPNSRKNGFRFFWFKNVKNGFYKKLLVPMDSCGADLC
uniref:Uncharacterized protein n=1 Tax=Panagrolaimus sp. PS1159 TaxID=55785 RepID=A0AC35GKR6_9BILA